MEKSSFFNSVNGDRKYNAQDFANYFNSFIGNGVFGNNHLQIQANNNMTITLKEGKAWANGYIYLNDSDLIKTIEPADGVLNRIDRLVLRLDYVNREIKSYVKKGTFASSPVAPTLQRDADMYELGIADIYIAKGATSILQANITDTRANPALCGWVNTLISGNIDALITDINSLEQTVQALSSLMADFTQSLDNHIGKGGAEHAKATTNADGFMSKEDKVKLDNATASATANRLLIRDASGRAKVAAPSASDDIARKADVDVKIDKPTSAIANNIAIFNSSKNVIDSGSKITDFQKSVKTYGYVKLTDTVPSLGSLTKNIPIGAGKTSGIVVMSRPYENRLGVIVFINTDNTKTKSVGAIGTQTYPVGATSRDAYQYVVGNSSVAGDGSSLIIKDVWINGNNISIVFENLNASKSMNLDVEISWEVW